MWPRSTRASATWLPMNPAPPVIRIRTLHPFDFEIRDIPTGEVPTNQPAPLADLLQLRQVQSTPIDFLNFDELQSGLFEYGSPFGRRQGQALVTDAMDQQIIELRECLRKLCALRRGFVRHRFHKQQQTAWKCLLDLPQQSHHLVSAEASDLVKKVQGGHCVNLIDRFGIQRPRVAPKFGLDKPDTRINSVSQRICLRGRDPVCGLVNADSLKCRLRARELYQKLAGPARDIENSCELSLGQNFQYGRNSPDADQLLRPPDRVPSGSKMFEIVLQNFSSQQSSHIGQQGPVASDIEIHRPAQQDVRKPGPAIRQTKGAIRVLKESTSYQVFQQPP